MVSNRVSEWLTFCVIPFTEETGHLSRWDKELITLEMLPPSILHSLTDFILEPWKIVLLQQHFYF